MFKPYDRNQEFCLPPSLRELIPEGDLVYFIAEVIDQLDLKPLYRKYDSLGQNAYHPGMMLGLLFYAYSRGIFSSRKIAEQLHFDVRFMYLSGMQRPDFHTIADFRKDNIKLLQKYFVDIVRLGLELGMVPLREIALDGSKFKASASRKRNRDREVIARQLAEVEAEIARLLEHAQSVDEAEDSIPNSDIPTDLQLKDLQQMRRKLQAAKAKLDCDPGQKRVNLSDPDCREQKEIGPGYNSQIAVDCQSQIIVGAKVVSDNNDSHQLNPMIEEVETVTASEGQKKKILTDSSFASAKAFRELEEKPHIDAYVPTRALVSKQRRPVSDFDKSRFKYDIVNKTCTCPQGHPMRILRHGVNKRGEPYINFIGSKCQSCPVKAQCTKSKYRNLLVLLSDPLIQKMEHKVSSPRGQSAMRTRKQSVEPVFGILKEQLNFRRFHLRGLAKVNGEFALLCGAFDLKKLHRFLSGRKLAEVMAANAQNIENSLQAALDFLFSLLLPLRFRFQAANLR